eukprot:2470441-Pleurochrysis_carterae.AAC.1
MHALKADAKRALEANANRVRVSRQRRSTLSLLEIEFGSGGLFCETTAGAQKIECIATLHARVEQGVSCQRDDTSMHI